MGIKQLLKQLASLRGCEALSRGNLSATDSSLRLPRQQKTLARNDGDNRIFTFFHSKCLKKLMLMIGYCLFPLAVFAATPVVTQVQALKFSNYTRLIFTVDDPEKYHVFTLTGPDRVVVDFNEAHLKADLKAIDFSGSPIQKVRTGHPQDNIYRIVFDAAVPVHIKKFITPDNNGHTIQLVVDVFPKESQEKIVTEAKPKIPEEKKVLPPVVKTVPKVVPPEVHKVVQAQKQKLQPTIQAPPANKPHTVVVVIDPGHGGKDPGTVSSHSEKEKDVVLNIALRLMDKINKEPNMRAVLTRNGDYFVSLRDRLKLARKDKADLFISIHADSYSREQFSGVSVYALSKHGATSEAARWLARRENFSELGGIEFGDLVDKSYILRSVLIDLAQTATITDSLYLGRHVVKELGKVAKLHKSWVEQAPFVVLKSPDIPSILVETGFLTNPTEEERLSDPAYRDKLAQALVNGIHHYLILHPIVGV